MDAPRRSDLPIGASMSKERDPASRDAETAGGRWARMSDAELVAAMQDREALALDQFIVRFSRLLLYRARRLGIARFHCEDAVLRVIEAVGLRLATGEIRIQSS